MLRFNASGAATADVWEFGSSRTARVSGRIKKLIPMVATTTIIVITRSGTHYETQTSFGNVKSELPLHRPCLFEVPGFH